jgi:hypothetical protein
MGSYLVCISLVQRAKSGRVHCCRWLVCASPAVDVPGRVGLHHKAETREARQGRDLPKTLTAGSLRYGLRRESVQ